MRIKMYQIDAFTEKLFSGNPAAVIPLTNWLSDELLQNIARENNLSETAFYLKDNNEYQIRWFTPQEEVDLCGHATLAASYVIFRNEDQFLKTIRFNSNSGPLRVTENENGLYALDFPARRPATVEMESHLTRCFNTMPVAIYRSRDYLFLFSNEKDIIDLKPDFDAIRQLDSLGVIATATGERHDFVSRFFAPKVGINEDPVTGSSHTTLIPFWSERLGKNKLTAYQHSSRGGELFCQYMNDRVIIAGKAVQYMEGEIIL